MLSTLDHPSSGTQKKAVRKDIGLLPFQRPIGSMNDPTLLIELYRPGPTESMADSIPLVELHRPVIRTFGGILLWLTRFYRFSLLTFVRVWSETCKNGFPPVSNGFSSSRTALAVSWSACLTMQPPSKGSIHNTPRPRFINSVTFHTLN